VRFDFLVKKLKGKIVPEMSQSSYVPVFELTRGETVESIHNGAAAVVDVYGNLLAWVGDPDTVTFLRSSAKPFQALPFIEQGGPQAFGLTPKEVALICASHGGTDEHAATARSIQAKTGVAESDLMCGVHEPLDAETAAALRERKEAPTPNRHNCSGKHSGMLAYVRLKQQMGAALPEGLPYIDFNHPIQKEIVHTFADMCSLPVDEVAMGVDGCSAPNFAVPLRSAALAYARLSDPQTGGVQPPERAGASQTIIQAMTAHPGMVGGPGRFDTRLMQVARGKLVSKGGAEAYQGIGLAPGVLGAGSPAVGIALKIADGDNRGIVHPAMALELLRQLGALTDDELQDLCSFGPRSLRFNWRKIRVGEAYPAFELNWTRRNGR
jgi:L-asparaginase II